LQYDILDLCSGAIRALGGFPEVKKRRTEQGLCYSGRVGRLRSVNPVPALLRVASLPGSGDRRSGWFCLKVENHEPIPKEPRLAAGSTSHRLASGPSGTDA
jgi:hypothetical protein